MMLLLHNETQIARVVYYTDREVHEEKQQDNIEKHTFLIVNIKIF